MCIGFLSLLGAKILGTRRGRRNDPPHCSAKTSTPHLPVVLHRDYLIDARTHKSHPAQNGAHIHFKQTIPWCLALSVAQNNNCKTGQWNFPLRHSCARGFMYQPPVGLSGREKEHKFQELPQGYYSSSSSPTPSLPLNFQSCSLATATDETLEMTKSLMVFHKSNVFSSVTPPGCSALSVWQQFSFPVEELQISPGEATGATMIYGRYL